MNILSAPTDKQISGQDLLGHPLEELEELLISMFSALEKMLPMISSCAQGTTSTEAAFRSVIGLENECKQTWGEMKATVEAIICHAILAEFNEQQWHKLAQTVREENAFLQAVTSGEDINPEWLTQRDTLAAQIASLLKECSD